MEERGFANVTELSAGEVVPVGTQVTVTAVEARHDGRRHPGGLRAETLGYVVEGRHAVYFAGDTELFDGMSELRSHERGEESGELPRFDVALLPVAGWGPTLGAGHMDPLDAARAVRLIRPRIAIPMHWGTLLPVGLARRHGGSIGDPPRIFAEHVASLAPGVEVRTLQPGQETTL
jgi:L-ascorbate metabolism protein UlaG (beta-lactamase superfamily)